MKPKCIKCKNTINGNISFDLEQKTYCSKCITELVEFNNEWCKDYAKLYNLSIENREQIEKLQKEIENKDHEWEQKIKCKVGKLFKEYYFGNKLESAIREKLILKTFNIKED